ncbi:MAG: hypothetical protein JW885_16375 [Deltaproteobacteria bacterium]|nr:hypothetical protein [Candidatus Zymogenaceae bacterium]
MGVMKRVRKNGIVISSVFFCLTVTVAIGLDARAADLDVTLRVKNTLSVPRAGEPVTSGVPIPESIGLMDAGDVVLLGPDGMPLPLQAVPLARWGGGPDDPNRPIRWLLLDFQADVPTHGISSYRLTTGEAPPAPAHAVTVTDAGNTVTIDTGAGTFIVSREDGSVSGPGIASPVRPVLADGNGVRRYPDGPVTVDTVMSGPLRVSIHVSGSFPDAGEGSVDFTARWWFYAGTTTARLFVTIENNTPSPLVEYGQIDCYDIGSSGSVTFADFSLVTTGDVGKGLTYLVAGDDPNPAPWAAPAGGGEAPMTGPLTDELVLYQDSSGTDEWDHYITFTDWDGNSLDTRPRMQAYVGFRGYIVTEGGGTIAAGDHSGGWVSISGDKGSLTAGIADFWQSFPKAIRAFPDGTVEIGLFPDEYAEGYGGGRGGAYLHTLRPGEHKTHEVALAFVPKGTSPPSGDALCAPLFAAAAPSWYVKSKAFGPTALPDRGRYPDYETYLDYQLSPSPEKVGMEELFDTLFDAISGTDFFGIYDFGDWPIDYEGYEAAPLNGKYDNDYGLWLQYLRRGDVRWFELARALDRHVADIDILHTLHTPRHWSDGIAFGHSHHDEDGFTNPHRNGGGNHPDTAYGMKGMLLLYYLTGYEKAYESAMELADCVAYRVENDANVCHLITGAVCSGEGYALPDGMYDSGCRPAANCLSILTQAYRATGDDRYLGLARTVVTWADPGAQPYIHGETGGDLYVKPWQLNMYLSALADYLEMHREFSLADTAGGRTAYLAYADWLVDYALLELVPLDGTSRAAYPYEWWLDGRTGDPADEWSSGNNVPSINNWLLLGADVMAYAYALGGDTKHRDAAGALFFTGSRDPWFEGDYSGYSESKQAVNGIAFGHLFLFVEARK